MYIYIYTYMYIYIHIYIYIHMYFTIFKNIVRWRTAILSPHQRGEMRHKPQKKESASSCAAVQILRDVFSGNPANTV